MAKKVLVVDDEKLIVKGIRFSLEQDGMQVDCAYDGQEAIDLATNNKYDIILLDVMLPIHDGFEVCQQIREFSDVPIIMLTAKGDDMDKILGLEYGADDYITKPFDMEEVLARIESNLRRVQFQKDNPTHLRHGDLVLDLNDNTAFLQGSELTLTAKEFAILELLMKYPDKIFSKANLFQSVWNAEYISEDNTLNVHISNLRNKLKAVCPDKDFIDTVWGIGYRLHKARD